jgi:competence protein ComGC
MLLLLLLLMLLLLLLIPSHREQINPDGGEQELKTSWKCIEAIKCIEATEDKT